MGNKKRERIAYWSAPWALVFIIYSTLPFGNDVYKYLSGSTFAATMFYALGGALLIYLIAAYGKRMMEMSYGAITLFVISAVAYGMLFTLPVLPVEKIHLIEYLVLGCLFVRAVSVDVEPPRNYSYAFILSFYCGWLDEVIQYYLPNRHFDWQDVLLNGAGAAFGIIFTAILWKDKARTSTVS